VSPIYAVIALLGALLLAEPSFAAGARRTITRVPPVYPELARRMHITGTVVVRLTVQPDGSVSDARIQSGHALLGPAAQDAVKRWKFEPGSDTTDMVVDVNFSDAQ
jgi:TonB family protein